MASRSRSGPRRRVELLGDRDRAKLGQAVRAALAAAGDDLEMVAKFFGLPESAVVDLLGDTVDAPVDEAWDAKQRTSRR